MPTNKIPLYPYNAKDAMKRGEIEKWRESFRENCACAGGIDILIRENFDGMHLKDGTVEKIVELYGYKRVEHVLANTVQERRGDGRFRPSNREWANSHYIPEDEMHNYCFAARSHSAILDGFISNYRKLVMNLGMFDQKHCEPEPEKLDYTGKVLVLSPNINLYPQQVEFIRNDTGEQIYQSNAIPVGSKIERAALDVELPAGSYECTAMFHNLDPVSGEIIGTAGAIITITIKN